MREGYQVETFRESWGGCWKLKEICASQFLMGLATISQEQLRLVSWKFQDVKLNQKTPYALWLSKWNVCNISEIGKGIKLELTELTGMLIIIKIQQRAYRLSKFVRGISMNRSANDIQLKLLGGVELNQKILCTQSLLKWCVICQKELKALSCNFQRMLRGTMSSTKRGCAHARCDKGVSTTSEERLIAFRWNFEGMLREVLKQMKRH